MPGTNIKQVEAAERSEIVKVKSYRIDLDLTTGAENFRVKTTVAFTGLKPGATTFIDCVGSKVISAKILRTRGEIEIDSIALDLDDL